MANYKNIPVDEDTYDTVKQLAVANGLGERGMGAQVKAWAERDSTACEHKKIPVSVEYSPSILKAKPSMRNGWYCPVCRRVYASGETTQEAQHA